MTLTNRELIWESIKKNANFLDSLLAFTIKRANSDDKDFLRNQLEKNIREVGKVLDQIKNRA